MTHPIRAQIMGKPLSLGHDHKVDFVLKSKRGRAVMSIAGNGQESLNRAEEEADKRGLDLYRVTTITEKLS